MKTIDWRSLSCRFSVRQGRRRDPEMDHGWRKACDRQRLSHRQARRGGGSHQEIQGQQRLALAVSGRVL